MATSLETLRAQPLTLIGPATATLTDSGDQSKAPSPTPRAPYAGQVPAPPNPAAPALKADDPDWEEAVKWAEEATNGESTA